MLNPLKNHILVLKVSEELEKVFIWGVKGQLGEGQNGGKRTVAVGAEVCCVLVETRVEYGCHHIQGVVKVLRLS